MSKPKSSIRDYGYNPNQYDSIQSMMDDVTGASIAYQGVLRKHSEFQEPYKADDYMKMDTGYDPFPGTPDWKGPIPYDPTFRYDYAESCLRLWSELFPGWTQGQRILETPHERAVYAQYAAKCPTNVLWKKCCNKLKIKGPDKVNHGDTQQYSVYPEPLKGCYVTWGAERGRCVGGTYIAPTSGESDTIYVDVFFESKHCAEKKIELVEAGTCASESIGISGTTQMSVGETKTLTVLNPVVGRTYTWVIAAGGGKISPRTGTTTTYTAPGTNPYCANNPTIQLKVGSNVCDSVSLAVNASTSPNWAVRTYVDPECNQPGDWCIINCWIWLNIYKCDNSLIFGPCRYAVQCSGSTCNEDGCPGGKFPTCDMCRNKPVTYPACYRGSGYSLNYWLARNPEDVRTENDKRQGCCPALLL
ncbi:MAG TPA: hypothetical protein PLJ03_10605 [Syntrophales bacterium]|nr:hypothetical protein [Syntrophales bacterium]